MSIEVAFELLNFAEQRLYINKLFCRFTAAQSVDEDVIQVT